MKPKRKEENVEKLTGLKGARVLADVSGLHVELLAFTFGTAEFIEGDYLDLLTPSMAEKIKESLRDYTPVADAVFDWDEVAK
jgi:hypothetical protein